MNGDVLVGIIVGAAGTLLGCAVLVLLWVAAIEIADRRTKRRRSAR